MQRRVVAVVGYSGSGMSTVSEILNDKGYAVGSGGATLRELSELLKRPTDRYSLIDLANHLRSVYGPTIVMEGVVRKLERSGSKDWVFDSIRNPWEVAYLKEKFGALVIGVNTPDNIRLSIMRRRKKEGDPNNMGELQALNRVEQGFEQPWWGQNIAGCLGLADVVITNNFDIPESVVAKRYLKPFVEDALALRGWLEGRGSGIELP
jgi:dephospho-CoA kinase